ncbi:GAF domain-containing protein [Bifidobacterium sp. ESL0728]|uniref:GAF domain-containing protein n=1 Tax=Bifidobacterium sp. ESL0728 TaxID=2983220 RepID=UPI0023F79C76|nr:GAF domain-containing protein [Bifidobacterium sp. ESL0728]WEV58987.1 GAF domain-containing protein [Bifidobacterium sp. ESL0728]
MIHPIQYAISLMDHYVETQAKKGIAHITKLQKHVKNSISGATLLIGIFSVSLGSIGFLSFPIIRQRALAVAVAFLSILSALALWVLSLLNDKLDETRENMEDRPVLLYSIITNCITNVVKQIAQDLVAQKENHFSMHQFCQYCAVSLWGALHKSTQSPRVTIYRIRHPKRQSPYLEPFATFGRSESRPGPFREDKDGRGSAVLNWLRSLKENTGTDQNGISRFSLNVHEDKEFKGTANGYTTYISSAIMCNKQIYGMLAIDTNNSGDFSKNDCRVIEAIAHILGLAVEIDIERGNKTYKCL